MLEFIMCEMCSHRLNVLFLFAIVRLAGQNKGLTQKEAQNNDLICTI